MGKVISLIGQKGGGSKSSNARTLAVAFTDAGWQVHLADLDDRQQTSMKWTKRREDAGLGQIDCAVYRRVDTAMKMKDQCHLLIIDGRPAAETTSLDVATESDLVIVATGTTIDDLEPSLELGRELVRKGVPANRIMFLITKAPSEAEGIKAQETVRAWGFAVFDSVIPFKTGYANALDAGKAMHETPFKTLNACVATFTEQVHDIINK